MAHGAPAFDFTDPEPDELGNGSTVPSHLFNEAMARLRWWSVVRSSLHSKIDSKLSKFAEVNAG
jgi:hypothetical protein